jgi:hypothetical protein
LFEAKKPDWLSCAGVPQGIVGTLEKIEGEWSKRGSKKKEKKKKEKKKKRKKKKRGKEKMTRATRFAVQSVLIDDMKSCWVLEIVAFCSFAFFFFFFFRCSQGEAQELLRGE